MVLVKKMFFILIISSFFISCEFFSYKSDAIEILVKADQFTLAWDLSGPNFPNSSSSIKSYKIFYRPHNSMLSWILLDELDNTGALEYVITDNALSYGKYDFAIRSVNKQGDASELHSSTDRTAEPITGWYINWIGSK